MRFWIPAAAAWHQDRLFLPRLCQSSRFADQTARGLPRSSRPEGERSCLQDDRAEAGCRFGNKTVVDIIIVCRQPVARRRRIAGDGRQVRSPAFGFVEGQSCPFVLPRVERAQTPAVSVEIYDAVHLTRDADGANLGMFTHKLLYEGQRRSIDFLRVLRPLPTLAG